MAFVQATSLGQSVSSASIATPAINTTTGNFLAFWLNTGSSTTISSVTDTFSNTWTALDAGRAVTGGKVFCYYAKNITGGSNHVVTVTPNASIGSSIGLVEFNGISTTSPIDNSVAFAESTRVSSHIGATTTQNIVSSAANCDILVLSGDSAGYDYGGNTTTYTGSGFYTSPAGSQVGNNAGFRTGCAVYATSQASGTNTPTWATGGPGLSVTSTGFMLSLAPSGGGGTSARSLLILGIG